MNVRINGRRTEFATLSPEDFEALVGEYLTAVGMEVWGRGRGADDGVDLLAAETRTRATGLNERLVTLVQCKHYTSKAVAPQDLDSIVDRCAENNASCYLLVCSGVVSSALIRKQTKLNEREDGPRFVIWDGVELERRLLQLSDTSVVDRFFPSSEPAAPIPARPPAKRPESLANEVARRFNLRRVVTCETPPDGALLYDALAEVAARYFYDNIPPNAVVGVSCGRTIFQMADRLPPFSRRLRVYPISFNVGPSLTSVMSPWATIFRICQQVGDAEGYELPLPAFFADPEKEWEMIRARPDMWELVERFRRPNVAFFSVGHLEAGSSYDWAADRLQIIMPGFTPGALRSLGACGEINWYPFTIDGEIVEHPIVDHGTSLGLREIRELAAARDRQMIVVAGGQAKAKPIVGALRGGFLNVLVCDDETLEEVARHVL